MTTLLAPTDSAEREARVRGEFASIPETSLIVGPPQECIERINAYLDIAGERILRSVHG